MVQNSISAENLNFGFIGWKSYNLIKKKAMEQEFSWSGLVISLSIAFFVVASSAQVLSLVYQSVSGNAVNASIINNQKIYRLESDKALNEESGQLKQLMETRKSTNFQNTYFV